MIWEKLEFSEEPQQQLKYESIEILPLCKLFFGSLEEEWLFKDNFFTETFYFVFCSKLLRLNVGKLYSVIKLRHLIFKWPGTITSSKKYETLILSSYHIIHTVPLTISYHKFWFLIDKYSVVAIW